MLMKICHFVQEKELRSIYFALFSTHLSYGCQIRGQTKNINSEKILKPQNRAQRIIDFTDFQEDVNPIYKSNKVLKDQIKIQNCLFVFDYCNDLLMVISPE